MCESVIIKTGHDQASSLYSLRDDFIFLGQLRWTLNVKSLQSSPVLYFLFGLDDNTHQSARKAHGNDDREKPLPWSWGWPIVHLSFFDWWVNRGLSWFRKVNYTLTFWNEAYRGECLMPSYIIHWMDNPLDIVRRHRVLNRSHGASVTWLCIWILQVSRPLDSKETLTRSTAFVCDNTLLIDVEKMRCPVWGIESPQRFNVQHKPPAWNDIEWFRTIPLTKKNSLKRERLSMTGEVGVVESSKLG